jgi:NAD-dependent SIR2 family protein deacetylase
VSDIRDRNVYILGAGFSASAGAPLVRDFIDRSRLYFDDPSSNLEKGERQHFERFLEFKRRMSQAREKVKIDLDDIEQLFGLVEMSQRLEHTRRDTRDSTVYVIAKTLEIATRSKVHRRLGFSPETALRQVWAPPPTFVGVPGYSPPAWNAGLYDFFAALGSGLLDEPGQSAFRANSFITFNYDLVLDDALRRVGVTPKYHLPPEYLLTKEAQASQLSCSVLKLHGSTNWGICVNCANEIVILDEKVTASPAEFTARVCTKCMGPRLQPMLVPPSWDKSEYRDIMKPIWSRAVEELKSAARICVIGYSMPEADSFFKYLIALALSENHNLYRFVVVDKNPQIAARYNDMLDQMFSQRRLALHVSEDGFARFLHSGVFRSELGRGEVVGGNIWMT